jgi:hypothetical protein
LGKRGAEKGPSKSEKRAAVRSPGKVGMDKGKRDGKKSREEGRGRRVVTLDTPSV